MKGMDIMISENMYVLSSESISNRYKDVKIEIPQSVVYIEKDLLRDNSRVKKITIHSKVNKIGSSAFRNCDSLERVKFLGDSELVTIPESCFRDSTKLKEFVIPNEVGVIKKYAFKNCIGIKHIVIPDTVIAIEAGAFDGWTKGQTIEMQRNFKFGMVCKANIINHSIDNIEVLEEEVYDTPDGKYMYAVKCKCGHVGRHRYMPITFPIIAESKKDAAKIARKISRVKHDHKDAILSVNQISKRVFDELVNINNEDPYLTFRSKYQQRDFKDMIDERALPETRL